jgi:hypothetical protein
MSSVRLLSLVVLAALAAAADMADTVGAQLATLRHTHLRGRALGDPVASHNATSNATNHTNGGTNGKGGEGALSSGTIPLGHCAIHNMRERATEKCNDGFYTSKDGEDCVPCPEHKAEYKPEILCAMCEPGYFLAQGGTECVSFVFFI